MRRLRALSAGERNSAALKAKQAEFDPLSERKHPDFAPLRTSHAKFDPAPILWYNCFYKAIRADGRRYIMAVHISVVDDEAAMRKTLAEAITA